jgi:Anion-transporting ATPase
MEKHNQHLPAFLPMPHAHYQCTATHSNRKFMSLLGVFRSEFRLVQVSNADVMTHVFFGKGGADKTTCVAASALCFAKDDDSSLVISTGPTPSRLHIFNFSNSKAGIASANCARACASQNPAGSKSAL